jgi:hypothetical protein
LEWLPGKALKEMGSLAWVEHQAFLEKAAPQWELRAAGVALLELAEQRGLLPENLVMARVYC